MKLYPMLLLLGASAAWSQADRGELRLRVIDPAGGAVRGQVELVSAANGYDKKFETQTGGRLDLRLLPFGVYQVAITQSGFAPVLETVEIRSAVPVERSIRLELASVHAEITVSGAETLLDTGSASARVQIGGREIEQRLSSLPGRSVQDLVVSQPGWLYEGNAVLHPRGAEYQTQFVVDGIPLTDNRSPSFGPEIEADDLESISIYTAGFPAEYGRKMGGVVELNTAQQTDPGLHGDVVLSGGSYEARSGYLRLQETQQRNTYAVSASGSATSHYLNPVVLENYTNRGTTADFAGRYERDLNAQDRLDVTMRHELSRFQIPNERLQQQAGQKQYGANAETMGTARYQRSLSVDSLLSLSGMVRQNSNDLESNVNPTPIAAFQHNHFSEGYFEASYALHHGKQDLKAGVESDATFLHEGFRYRITDPSEFDAGTPTTLSFAEARPDLEQAAFVEDMLHLGNWNLSLGLRWDHYQLLMNRHGLSPRISVARAFPKQAFVVHASFDRIFQTPSFENILLSSSPQVMAISEEFLRVPVRPSTGNDYEGGVAKAVANRVRLDVNAYTRHTRNAADDDQLLNTGVSYPISFDHESVYGVEGKLQALKAGPMSGFVSYAYMVGKVWFPVTGGLFLGDDAASVLGDLHGHFPATQDQRNTAAARVLYGVTPRMQVAAGASYGSGLPFEYGGSEQAALAQYGPAMVNRLNFDRGRIRPLLAVNASLIVHVLRRDAVKMNLRVDGENLNNRLNVLDFGGLFSGNAIAPGRSVMLRWDMHF